MKKNDITLIVGTMLFGAVLAVLVTSVILSNSISTQQRVQVVNTINTSFQPPSNQYLNSSSIDPTLLVKIGNNSNTAPFSQ
jgi:hypothetical protein